MSLLSCLGFYVMSSELFWRADSQGDEITEVLATCAPEWIVWALRGLCVPRVCIARAVWGMCSGLKVSNILGFYVIGCEISASDFLWTCEVCEVGEELGVERVDPFQSLRPQNCFLLCPQCKTNELLGTLCLRVWGLCSVSESLSQPMKFLSFLGITVQGLRIMFYVQVCEVFMLE